MRKIIKLAVPLILGATILTGCSLQQASFNPVDITKPPSWDTSVAETLKKDGWQVMIMPTKEQKQQVKNAPTIFKASHNKNKCIISYSSDPNLPKSFKLDERFNTESFMLDRISLSSGMAAREAVFETMQVGVKDSSEKTSMLYTGYIEPYYGDNIAISTAPSIDSQPQNSGEPQKLSKPEGEIYSFMAARSFSKTIIDNPFEAIGNKYNANVGSEMTSVVYIQYQCLNKELDDKIIDIIKTESKLVLE